MFLQKFSIVTLTLPFRQVIMCLRFLLEQDMKIKRDYYLNKLIQHKKNGLVKIVTGVRRCGKSYLLFQLFCDHLLEIGRASCRERV